MTVAAPAPHEHVYVCVLTKNQCVFCDHVEGTPENGSNIVQD